MILYLILLVTLICLIFIDSKKSLHMLQQNLYNENNRYLKWIFKNNNFFSLQICSIMISLIAILVVSGIESILMLFLILLIGINCYESFRLKKREINDKKHEKKPLVITKRVKRLIFTITVLYLIPFVFALVNYNSENFIWIIILVLVVLTYLNRFVVLIANIINKPYEKGVYYYYLYQAKKKLKNMSNMKVIGVTGSYGKTSSKNILSDILNIKYNTLPTPRNLNTPYGLMITINNHMDKFTEVFIAEMGAYVRGEIKELCDFVHPKYGILTRIGTAHLESFGSEENIQRGKFELIESLPPDGIGVLNGDDPKQVNYDLKNKVKLLWIGIDNKDVDVRAENIKCSNKGTSFDCIFKGDSKKYKFETKLLGKHNVYNILAGIALGREFGINVDELIKSVKGVKPIEHRLELKKLNNFYMIDDAYNSNPVGAKSAVDVLNMMDGVKIVVTPGMVELGENEDKYNNEFGKQIAEVADYVLLIGKKKSKPIYNGLIEKKFDKDKIVVYNDVKDAYKFIIEVSSNSKKEVYALFENDLPDSYNE